MANRNEKGQFVRKAPDLDAILADRGYDLGGEPIPPVALEFRDPALPALEPDLEAILAEPPEDWDGDDEDRAPGVPGCNCDICRRARGEIGDEPDYVAPIPEAQKGKPLKVLPKKKASKPETFDMKMADIPLLDPAKATLDKAIALMIEYRDQARKSTKVSQFILVGPKKIKKRLNEICHACLANDLPGNKDNQLPKVKNKWDSAKSREMYWNFEHECWQEEYVERGKGRYGPMPKPKKQSFPYRYMVGFSNHQQKPQYHPGDTAPFKGKRLKACKKYWYWLRNKSHWSCFFVGPKDEKFITDYGFILDLSAPAFIVHMAAVAWRMPGEYIELVENWYAMVKRGIDPHVAFAVAQNYGGFDDPAGDIYAISSAGHNLLYSVSWEGMARLVTGTVWIDSKRDLMQARIYYDCNSNRHYAPGSDYGGGSSWFQDPDLMDDPSRATSITRPGWFGGPDVVVKSVSSRAFQRMFDPGWAWLFAKLNDEIVKKGWY